MLTLQIDVSSFLKHLSKYRFVRELAKEIYSGPSAAIGKGAKEIIVCLSAFL